MFAVDDMDRPRRVGFLPYLFGGITGVALGLVIVVGALLLKNSGGAPPIQIPPAQTEPAALPASTGGDDIDVSRRTAIVRATQRVAPAVVSITATRTERTRYYSWYWDRYYPGPARTYSSLGSGVIVDPDGYVFTNHHVIQDAQKISATTYSGETYQAKLVYSAPSYDLALLKIDGKAFPVAPLGDSDQLKVGEWAIAIGSPFGTYLVDKQPTVTVGVISANHRDIKQQVESERVFNDMIQTDAAINPGNSGGPLVDADGEVIGINTVIFSGGSGANIGMGFAIPINRARRVFQEVSKYGRVRDVWLGMTATNITPELASGLDLPSTSGVLVHSVERGGPADKAGIEPGDQLLAINGIPVQSREHANRIIFGSAVGDVLEITINRKDHIKDVQVKLEERPADI